MQHPATQTASAMFATARIYALFSIVSAHLVFPGTLSGTLLERLGTLGVILFLFMAGYFFRPAKFASLGTLFKKKAITICIPWGVLGFVTFVYKAILSPSFRSVPALLRWMLGYQSYLYYLPILLLCFLLFYKAPKACLWAALPITLCSVLLSAAGVLDPVISALRITHYLNPLNWLGFFALGMLAQSIGDEALFAFFKRLRLPLCALFLIAISLLLLFREVRADYFSFVAIPFELLGGAAVLGLSTITLTHIPLLGRLSATSFSIYLLHMVFIGLLDALLAKAALTRLLAPAVIIALCFALFLLLEWIAKRLKLQKIYQTLSGVRSK